MFLMFVGLEMIVDQVVDGDMAFLAGRPAVFAKGHFAGQHQQFGLLVFLERQNGFEQFQDRDVVCFRFDAGCAHNWSFQVCLKNFEIAWKQYRQNVLNPLGIEILNRPVIKYVFYEFDILIIYMRYGGGAQRRRIHYDL